ncbi:MAG: ADP-ribosylglycohydrolase family protein [Anaerolineaceae bacterium]
MYDLYDRILGCLVTAAMADAMGAPSEALSRDEIIETFGKPIDGFFEVKDNIYVIGNHPGEITDDTSQMYEMAKAVIETEGELTIQAAANALIAWSMNYPKYYPRNAGPTMSHVINELRSGADPSEVGKIGKVYGRGVSSGAAMRVASAGLCNPGNLEGAVQTAVIMTAPSHATQHAYSGACAIACGIAEAITEHAEIYTVLKAIIYGAKRGEELGIKTARSASGCRVLPKIIKAIECAVESDNLEHASHLIEDLVGNDGQIQSCVAAAVGLFTASEGNPVDNIRAAANIGGDTDTIGCVTGSLSGALKGFNAIPDEWYKIFIQANPDFDFKWVARELTRIAKKRLRN